MFKTLLLLVVVLCVAGAIGFVTGTTLQGTADGSEEVTVSIDSVGVTVETPTATRSDIHSSEMTTLSPGTTSAGPHEGQTHNLTVHGRKGVSSTTPGNDATS